MTAMSPGSAERARWNERHGRDARPPGAAAEWLVAHRALLDAQPRGRALDLACGRGRNALELARMGFAVDAVDISDVAVEAVRAAAAEQGLPVTAHRADLSGEPFPRPPYDVIVDVNYLERSLFEAIPLALAPGGLLVFETFTREHAGIRAEFGLAVNEPLRAFRGLRVLHYREVGGRAGLVARRQ
jgi:tellurite methyltransferase